MLGLDVDDDDGDEEHEEEVHHVQEAAEPPGEQVLGDQLLLEGICAVERCLAFTIGQLNAVKVVFVPRAD